MLRKKLKGVAAALSLSSKVFAMLHHDLFRVPQQQTAALNAVLDSAFIVGYFLRSLDRWA